MINGKRRLVTSELSIPSDRRPRANSQFPMANWRYRGSDRTYTLSPSRFYTPFSTIPHLRHRRTPTRRVAGNGTVSAVDGSSITFPSRTPSSARVCPRFHRCAFKQVPSATFFKRFVSAHATDRAIHAHARVESTYYFSSSLSEILKTKRNEINAKLFQLFNLFDRSDLDTDRPISASLLYFGLFVNEIKRVCTCITGISWQSERMRV